MDTLAREVLESVHATIRRHQVTYDEYHALKAWLIQVGQDGEWPLFLDVWVEHAVEEVANADRTGNKGTIEGPYYVPGAPEQGATGTVPMREDETGTPLTWTGTVTSTDGRPLEGAKIEIWHADDDGYYSQFAPGLPEWNLRGTFTLGDGRRVRDPHDAARAVPDPDRRLLRQAHRGGRLARLAPGPHPREGLRAGTPPADRAAVLPR